MIPEALEIILHEDEFFVARTDKFRTDDNFEDSKRASEAGDIFYNDEDYAQAAMIYEEVLETHGVLSSRKVYSDDASIANCYGLMAMRNVNSGRFEAELSPP